MTSLIIVVEASIINLKLFEKGSINPVDNLLVQLI